MIFTEDFGRRPQIILRSGKQDLGGSIMTTGSNRNQIMTLFASSQATGTISYGINTGTTNNQQTDEKIP